MHREECPTGMTSFKVNLVCHLADFATSGVEELLDRAQGELGVTGISVPVVCPPVARLRTGTGVSPRIARSPGGVFFEPQERHYAATRCKPIIAGLPKSRGLFESVVQACRARDLDCRAVIHAATAGQMATKYSQTAAQTAFGDPWPGRVCLVNPDVQAFLAAVCDDLASNYEITGLELAEVHVGRLSAVSSALDLAFDVGPGGLSLLGVCFCESCRQLTSHSTELDARLDASAAARSVEIRLGRIFETGKELLGEAAGVFADDEPLQGHVAAQWHAVRAAVRTIPRRPGCDLVVHVYEDTVSAQPGWPHLLSVDAPPTADAVMVVPGPASGHDPEQAAASAIEQASAGIRMEMLVDAYQARAGDVTPPEPAALVRSLRGLSARGVASVDLDGYGMSPAVGLTAIKQAVRFARRGPGGGPHADSPG